MHNMMYGTKRTSYKISIPHLSMTKLALCNMAQLIDSIDVIIEMCFIHVNILSIKTPKKNCEFNITNFFVTYMYRDMCI